MSSPCQQEVAHFEHDTLPDASKYIRLVEVLEDDHSEAFQAKFRMSTWRIDGLPSYHAISYTWGDPKSNTAILINGKTFRVRNNCKFALKQAWWYKSNGYYWIDAMCINQGNDEEKGKQVAMMGNIYKTAYKVLACVGDHSNDSLFLYKHLTWPDDIAEWMSTSPGARDLVLHRTHRFLTIRRYLRAAVHFMKRPYFSRLWIVQELQGARQANVMCGTDALPKQRIHKLFRVLFKFGIFNPPQLSRTQRLAQWTLRAMFYRPSTPDWQLFIELTNAMFVTDDFYRDIVLFLRSASLQCTQRRDRIYGTMSLINWGDIVPPIPDYTKSDMEVALDWVRPTFELIRGEDIVELLDVCAFVAQALELGVRSDSVSGALEARRGACEGDFAGYSMRFNPPPTQFQSEVKGWRLSGEHFINRRQFTSSEWKVPNSTGITAVLPHWFREGDWILEPNKFYTARGSVLVARDVADGFYSLILGQGRLSSTLLGTEASAIFHVFWDTEDVLLHYLVSKESFNSGISEVDFGLCRREKPGSSYAVRQNRQNHDSRSRYKVTLGRTFRV